MMQVQVSLEDNIDTLHPKMWASYWVLDHDT